MSYMDSRSSLIRVFPVCYSDKHFVNSDPDNKHFIRKQTGKSVQTFRTFAVCWMCLHCNSGLKKSEKNIKPRKNMLLQGLECIILLGTTF